MPDKLYLNKVQLQAELDRCLNCPTKPCQKACPVGCCPQTFIKHAKNREYDNAVKAILSANPLGQTCGLICPNKFCQQACTRTHIDFAINIPKVQATLLQMFQKENFNPSAQSLNNKHIAVIGAGPAGLAATATLVRNGCQITVFEKQNTIGGALNLIPDERLPHEVIEKDWKRIFSPHQVTLRLNTPITDLKKLLTEFDCVIAAIGTPKAINLGIEGEELSIPFTDYLRTPERYQTNGNVAIIGGGNVAVDCALTAKNNGAANVEVFVRRRLADMRISSNEYLELLSKEIDISPLTSPQKLERNKDKLCLTVCKNRISDGKAVTLPNSLICLLGFDLVIKAVGSRPVELIEDPRIIYCGDCKNGCSTAVEAVASGKEAATLALQQLDSF